MRTYLIIACIVAFILLSYVVYMHMIKKSEEGDYIDNPKLPDNKVINGMPAPYIVNKGVVSREPLRRI